VSRLVLGKEPSGDSTRIVDQLPSGMHIEAMVKSDHEDGHLFAALSHRALELLNSGTRFNTMDICQCGA